jgi:4-amino-4-deoxy-L-arabinose transferase-like glycosyltransferase
LTASPPQNLKLTAPPAWAWWLLILVYVGLVVSFMACQPLAAPPDELAHMRYVKFIADQERLPRFDFRTGGEAGYEGQQPPFFYLVSAGVYELTSPLEARWRWSVVRLVSLACGLILLGACRRLFREVLPGRWTPLLATGLVVLLPTVLFYSSHLNPDIMVVMWAGVVLGLAWQTRWQPGNLRLAALLGLACGLAILTKLSAGPLLVVALAAEWGWREQAGKDRFQPALRGMAITFLAFLLTCGWYFRYNILTYGKWTLHTPPPAGSGWEEAQATHLFAFSLKLMLKNTYLSTWAPITWTPPDFTRVLLYGAVSVFVLLGVGGLILRRRAAEGDERLRFALNLSGLLVVLIVIGHQFAYWLADVDFNMGGRYIMVALPALVLLLVVGVQKWGPRLARLALPIWLAVLLGMSGIALWMLVIWVNPIYSPGWQPFHFSTPVARSFPTRPPQ